MRKVADGSLSVEEVEQQLKILVIEEMANILKLDVGREIRKSVPEIILSEYKSADQLELAIRGLLEARGRAIASRLREDQLEVVRKFERDYDVVLSLSLIHI